SRSPSRWCRPASTAGRSRTRWLRRSTRCPRPRLRSPGRCSSATGMPLSKPCAGRSAATRA
ncbi:MAG: hypothetical protein AVDCRST_MAG47-191, partial [uncultured Nocardioidaceae bacterium]